MTSVSRNVEVYDTTGKPSENMVLPAVFSTPFRPDVIEKAVTALQSRRYQPKGRNPMAGKRTTAESMGVGRDLARVPRVKGDRYPRASQAAFAPSTVKGRLTHPPYAQRRLTKRMNKKERLLALQSAIAATGARELIAARGHRIDKVPSIPLVVTNDLQRVKTTAEARGALKELGLLEDISRAKEGTKIRAGRGPARGRKTKHPRGPLLVVGEDAGISKAVRNLTGVDVVEAQSLNVENLAPGTHAGRLTVWTKSALELIGKRFAQRRS